MILHICNNCGRRMGSRKTIADYNLRIRLKRRTLTVSMFISRRRGQGQSFDVCSRCFKAALKRAL